MCNENLNSCNGCHDLAEGNARACIILDQTLFGSIPFQVGPDGVLVSSRLQPPHVIEFLLLIRLRLCAKSLQSGIQLLYYTSHEYRTHGTFETLWVALLLRPPRTLRTKQWLDDCTWHACAKEKV